MIANAYTPLLEIGIVIDRIWHLISDVKIFSIENFEWDTNLGPPDLRKRIGSPCHHRALDRSTMTLVALVIIIVILGITLIYLLFQCLSASFYSLFYSG